MFKDLEIKIIQSVKKINSNRILIKDLGDLGKDMDYIVQVLKRMKKNGLIKLFDLSDNTDPLILGLTLEGEEYADYFDKIDELVNKGRVLLTKNKKIGNIAILAGELNNELFISWKTACIAFLSALENQEYNKSFVENVKNPKYQDIKNGIEILESVKLFKERFSINNNKESRREKNKGFTKYEQQSF